MNSAISTQRNNNRFFFLSLFFSVILVAASGFFVKQLFSGDTGGVDASVKSCLATMRTNGFNPTLKDKDQEISITLATTMNIENLVYKSGVIIAQCPVYTLADYCAGTGCPKSGVTFTLKHK